MMWGRTDTLRGTEAAAAPPLSLAVHSAELAARLVATAAPLNEGIEHPCSPSRGAASSRLARYTDVKSAHARVCNPPFPPFPALPTVRLGLRLATIRP